MKIRELIEQLQRFDQDFEVKAESIIPISVQCPECDHLLTKAALNAEVGRVKATGHRCEVVIECV